MNLKVIHIGNSSSYHESGTDWLNAFQITYDVVHCKRQAAKPPTEGSNVARPVSAQS